MKTQNSAFRKNWYKNIKEHDTNHINKINIYKPVLKITLLLLIIFTVFMVYKWSKKIPEVELLNINKEPNLYQPDTLLRPKLLIKNKSNEPITIEAIEAKKDSRNSNIIILEKPKGHYKLLNNKNIYFYSAKGMLDSNKGVLKLIDNVKIESSEGMKLITNNIIYNIKNNIVTGKDIVILKGEWGILKGKGFSYNIEKSIIKLKGNPKLSLYSKGKAR